MAQEKLNLFQFASATMAQAGASGAKIVWCQIVYACPQKYITAYLGLALESRRQLPNEV